MRNKEKRRYIIQLSGIVQGVGFRPYIYQKAKEYRICGWVNNTGARVVMDVEANRGALKSFLLDVIKNPPILAKIEKVSIRMHNEMGYNSFEIRHSDKELSKIKLISPDISVCYKCMEEVFNPDSRRYRYAFTNCTECGPRYTIIKSLPYDRKNTSMNPFSLCEHCRDEYSNPKSRRFHTQPNCCSHCGPTLFLMNQRGKEISCWDVIHKTAELIGEGKIVAIKGMGGFHLCCDAQNEEAISQIRQRKNRPHKPLAIMVKDIEVVYKYCELTQLEQEVLMNPRRPIVLLKKKSKCILPGNIAPYQNRLGIMLPYLPIHHMLFEGNTECLVMTSANRSGSALQYKNATALANLGKVADYFLLHNRDIHNPIDDSVIKIIENKEMFSRRARGYIPYAKNMGIQDEILALGAEQKSTFSISQNGYIYFSSYLGDLKDKDSYDLYKRILKNFTVLIHSTPKIVAHDSHPKYLSTRYAKTQEGHRIAIQHHHAHMVSCMAEHALSEKVIGVIFDGTGLGTDGTIWGGEFLVGDRRDFIRWGYLKPVLLQGGDSTIHEPWKTAVSYLYSIRHDPKSFLKNISHLDVDIIQQALAFKYNCHLSSSMGRLFDCVSALIGIREHITYDAQAAIELENIADPNINTGYYYLINQRENIFELDYERIILGILEDLENAVLPSIISARFHDTISNATVEIICKIRDSVQLNQVVLSGGVFENSYLLQSVYKKLKAKDFDVFFNQQIPINDSGISFGQIVIADEIMKR